MNLLKISNSLQVSSASVSLVASSSLALIVYRTENGLNTPYRRIIFALSVSDILQSIGIVTGPFAVPSSIPQAIWSSGGNKVTCIFDGLIFTFGSSWAQMYSSLLSIYYFCKLHKHMTDNEFYTKIERKFHISIVSFMVVANVVALSLDSINPATTGSVCLYAATPTGCRQNPEIFGECDGNETTTFVISILLFTLVPFCCLGISVMLLIFLFFKIVARERIFASSCQSGIEEEELKDNPKTKGLGLDRDIEKNSDTTGLVFAKNEDEEVKDVERRTDTLLSDMELRRRDSAIQEVLSKSYRREMMLQVILYSLSFVATYAMFTYATLRLMSKVSVPIPLLLYVQTMFPLQGLFNIIIFMRPAAKVTKTRWAFSSWCSAFWLVFTNGGETPASKKSITSSYYMNKNAIQKKITSVKFGVENDSYNVPESDSVNLVSMQNMKANRVSEIPKGLDSQSLVEIGTKDNVDCKSQDFSGFDVSNPFTETKERVIVDQSQDLSGLECDIDSDSVCEVEIGQSIKREE